ncbi:MAG: hypothetical protein KDD66_07085 [Bdellovibrionales bacterium]|nr:hypothetical protein [Bdellovibrionales bacterium]
MNIGDVPSASCCGASTAAAVKVASSQEDQHEAVVGTILQGIDDVPAPRVDGVGGNLNVVA